jgi:EAL domain-containing protein (putative c-di-GMP-specific phosphodiesterase class I)
MFEMTSSIQENLVNPMNLTVNSAMSIESGLKRIFAKVPRGAGWATYPYNTLTLGSHFQPIFEVSTKACIGYEALLQATNLTGHVLRPDTVFSLAGTAEEAMYMDWLCRALHLRNFINLGDTGRSLFLNVFPEVAAQDVHHPELVKTLLSFYQANPSDVVIEILETGVQDETRLIDAVALYKALGCKVALDDFGIGYSNFDRIWRLQPDFVKLDGSLMRAAGRDESARRVFLNIVKLIHECGAQVVVEGVEERTEALIALDSGAGFLQGFYFAKPSSAPIADHYAESLFAGIAH